MQSICADLHLAEAAIYEAKAHTHTHTRKRGRQLSKGVGTDAETFDSGLRRLQLVVALVAAAAADDAVLASNYISCNLILALKCIH